MSKTTTLYSICALSFILIFTSCDAKFFSAKQVLEHEGEVFVYFQPFPQEAERLRFELEGIEAIREDGTTVPLSLGRKTLEPALMKRQRLAAAGIVPPGTYRGFLFKTAKAWLRVDEEETELHVKLQPVFVELPFAVARKKASTVFLNFLYFKSVIDNTAFVPAFSPYRPSTPATGLIGYVSNTRDNTITVFDKKAGQVLSVIATGREPRGIVFDQVRYRAYIALSGEDAIAVIDMTTGDSLNTIHLYGGDAPEALALTPDGRTLVSVNAGSNSVSFLDPLASIEIGRTSVGLEPFTILLEPTVGRRAYVFNLLSNSISIVDTVAKNTALTRTTEPRPVRGQFDKKGSRLYVIYDGSPYLTVMDITTLQVTKRTLLGGTAEALKVDTNTDRIYVAQKRKNELNIIEPVSLTAIDFIPTEGSTSYLTIDGQENSLLLLSREDNTLTSINLNARKETYVIDVGDEPYQVAVMGER
ncbi:MAG TPA: hypothetical protein VK654_14210 [Nitrospirota bacterium]|nr:hypothetical protein [Nitrospirota bacterium]